MSVCKYRIAVGGKKRIKTCVCVYVYVCVHMCVCVCVLHMCVRLCVCVLCVHSFNVRHADLIRSYLLYSLQSLFNSSSLHHNLYTSKHSHIKCKEDVCVKVCVR